MSGGRCGVARACWQGRRSQRIEFCPPTGLRIHRAGEGEARRPSHVPSAERVGERLLRLGQEADGTQLWLRFSRPHTNRGRARECRSQSPHSSRFEKRHCTGERTMHDSRIAMRPGQQVAALQHGCEGECQVAWVKAFSQLAASLSFK